MKQSQTVPFGGCDEAVTNSSSDSAFQTIASVEMPDKIIGVIVLHHHHGLLIDGWNSTWKQGTIFHWLHIGGLHKATGMSEQGTVFAGKTRQVSRWAGSRNRCRSC